MPQYTPGNGGIPGHMVLGDGPKGFLLTLNIVEGGAAHVLMVEVWATSMIAAIAKVEEISTGEVVTCMKLWV